MLTLNIFLRPPLVKSNKSDYKNARMKYFLENIVPHYDIICLQEVFRKFNTRAQQIIRGAAECGLIYSAKCPAPSESKALIDGGVLVLSRFDIIDHKFLPYEHSLFPDSCPSKVSCL